MIDRSQAADSRLPKLADDPTEKADSAEPIDPIDSTDPIEPIDSTDPFEAILNTESLDRIDKREPLAVIAPSLIVPDRPDGPRPGDAICRLMLLVAERPALVRALPCRRSTRLGLPQRFGCTGPSHDGTGGHSPPGRLARARRTTSADLALTAAWSRGLFQAGCATQQASLGISSSTPASRPVPSGNDEVMWATDKSTETINEFVLATGAEVQPRSGRRRTDR